MDLAGLGAGSLLEARAANRSGSPVPRPHWLFLRQRFPAPCSVQGQVSSEQPAPLRALCLSCFPACLQLPAPAAVRPQPARISKNGGDVQFVVLQFGESQRRFQIHSWFLAPFSFPDKKRPQPPTWAITVFLVLLCFGIPGRLCGLVPGQTTPPASFPSTLQCSALQCSALKYTFIVPP